MMKWRSLEMRQYFHTHGPQNIGTRGDKKETSNEQSQQELNEVEKRWGPHGERRNGCEVTMTELEMLISAVEIVNATSR